MKRIISLVLSVIMLFSILTVANAADAATADYNKAEEFAFALGIVDKATYKDDAHLTRAEFSELVYNLLTAGEEREVKDDWQEDNFGEDTKDELVVLGDTKIFDDVDIAVPQYKAIKYMVENGYMNGMTDKHFGPGYNISVAAVAKVMVNILGYEFMAGDNGGFPTGYMFVANKIKILSGISSGANDFITAGECLNIFYNALDVKLFDLSYIEGNGGIYLEKGEESFLTAGLGFVEIEGIVEDTGITTLYGASKVGEKRAVIDGVTVDIGSCTEIRSYIGREVSAFCYYDDAGMYMLKHIVAEDEVFTIDAADFVSFGNGKMSYVDENDRIKTVNTVSKNKLKVIYNGKAVSSYKDDIFVFPFGDITLVATSGSAYDLAIIRDYKTAMVSKVRATDMYVYGETLYSGMDIMKYLNLSSQNDVISIHSADGNPMEVGQIAKGDVISAMISADGKYIDAIVSKSVVSGFVVDSISDNANEIIYSYGTDEYALTFKHKLSKTPAVKLGKTYNLYFDYKGRLAYIDVAGEDSSDEKAAFIAGVDESGNTFNKEYKIRLYTEDGLMVVYDFDERVVLNGSSAKTENVFADIQSACVAQKAVLYSADSKTKIIKSITLPLEFGEEDIGNRGWYHISPDEARLSLKDGEEATDDAWKTNINTYGLKWFVNGYTFGKLMFWDKAFTKTMSVPSYESQYGDERNFMVSSGTAPFGNTDEKFLVHGYSRDPKAMAADLLVYASAELGAEKVVTTSFFVVEELIEALGRDDEPVTKLTGYEVVLSPASCKKVSYVVDENTYFAKLVQNQSAMNRIDPDNYDITVDGPGKVEDLEPGDIIRFSKSPEGNIRSIFVNYDESQNLYFCRTPISSKVPFEGEMNINLGYPLYVTGSYIRMADTKYLPEELAQNTVNLLDPTKLMAHNVGTRPVVVVEKIGARTVLRQGTIDDVVPYEDTGVRSEYEKVAGILYGGQTIGTVVYKTNE